MFTDDMRIGLASKEVIEQTSGAWLVEIPELSGMSRADIELTKAMIVRQCDKARPAYGRFSVERPRQFTLWGTVNDSQYLRDSTGNRRFWPVRVGQIDCAALARDRDQLWAEAAHYERQGEVLELPQELWAAAAEAQEARVQLHPIEIKLTTLLEDKVGRIAIDDLRSALGIESHRQDGNIGRVLAGAMTKLGFERKRDWHPNGKRVYFYTKGKGGWFTI